MESDLYVRLTALESQVAYLLAHLGIDPAVAAGDWSAAGPAMSGPPPGDGFNAMPQPGPPRPGSFPAGAVPPAVAAALQRGKPIQAIKIYHDLTGMPLKDAKVTVENMARDMGIRI